jgi:hypothetical protein
MSKKCPICGSINCIVGVGKAGAGKPWFTCLHCHTDLWEEEILPVTVFDRITESVETLADEFVDALYDRVAGEYRYYSMLTAEFYDSRKEALTATVAELKNEYKEQSK